jgi:hypothetical protein
MERPEARVGDGILFEEETAGVQVKDLFFSEGVHNEIENGKASSLKRDELSSLCVIFNAAFGYRSVHVRSFAWCTNANDFASWLHPPELPSLLQILMRNFRLCRGQLHSAATNWCAELLRRALLIVIEGHSTRPLDRATQSCILSNTYWIHSNCSTDILPAPAAPYAKLTTRLGSKEHEGWMLWTTWDWNCLQD